MLTDRKFYAVMSVVVLLPGLIVFRNGGSVGQSLAVSGALLVLSCMVVAAYVMYIFYAPDASSDDVSDKTFWNALKTILG